ncbi:MAG TPA: helix-turn-helix transcriptional regulator [Actinomycetota bacterium]|nr:helix-turn-helix transcriptional regulator [Actinomycetota bacterium]
MSAGGGTLAEPISLADRLKARRDTLGISQAQAARELEVARTAYRLWELEAARPAPDRWRLLARWLGVSMSTLMLSAGLISEEEAQVQADAAERFRGETGAGMDDFAQQSGGDFFRQAQSVLDRSIERGVLTAAEAGQFRDMFERVRRGLASSR